MASVTMSATFLGGAALTHRLSAAAPRRNLIISAATKTNGAETAKVAQESSKREAENGRRDMMFAAAAAAMCSIAGVAMAEPSRGTKEAKKAYAPVCVTMPTARICHK